MIDQSIVKIEKKLFGTVKLTANTTRRKFIQNGFCSFGNRSACNFIIIGMKKSSSRHSENFTVSF